MLIQYVPIFSILYLNKHADFFFAKDFKNSAKYFMKYIFISDYRNNSDIVLICLCGHQVHFTGGMFGSFSQWIVLDFGQRPVLVRKLAVEIGDQMQHEKVLKKKFSLLVIS